ncbi:MAG: hypothetical protein AB7J32_22665, partial [Pseudonocardia sp.]
EVRARQIAVRLQALHEVGVRVELALEAPDDEAAPGELDLLGAAQELVAPIRVGLPLGQVDQRRELGSSKWVSL